MTEPRLSTEIRAENPFATGTRLIVGVCILLFFGYSQFIELKSPPLHMGHAAFLSAGFLVGCATIFPHLTVILRKFLGLYRETRRWDDPQPPKGEP